MDDLVVFTKEVTPLEVFTESTVIDSLLDKIKAQARGLVPDLSTKKSRQEIASMAYKVSQSKTMIDNAGKELVKGWKQKAKQVDIARKKTREALDSLRDEVRQPLTEWEEAEKERKLQNEKDLAYSLAWDEAHKEHDLF